MYLAALKTEKHHNSPSSGRITTVPTTRSLLERIRGRWNAKVGWWHHYRRRAAMGSIGDRRCGFFSLLPMSEAWGGSGGWLDKGIALIDAVTCWEEAARVWRRLVECRHQSAIDG